MKPSRLVISAAVAAIAACSSDINEPLSPGSTEPANALFVAAHSPRIEIGSTEEISAAVRDNRGRDLSDRTVTWSSSDVSVATVVASGSQRAIVTARNGGSVTISGSVEGLTTTFDIETIPVAATTSARSQAFVYSAEGGMVVIPGISGVTMSWASAINESGEVTGGMVINGRVRAFAWTPGGTMTDLGTLSGGNESSANGINARGEIVGWSSTESGDHHAFKWSKESGMVDLGTIPGTAMSEATGINASGEVVGYSGSQYDPARSTSGQDTEKPFRWSEDKGMVELSMTDGNSAGTAYAIADDGTAVGRSTEVAFDLYRLRAVLWTPGNGSISLGDCYFYDDDCNVVAFGINQSGSIVGSVGGKAALFPPTDRRLTYVTLGIMRGADHSEARAINEAGQVVGTNFYKTGQRAFLWTASDGMRDMGALAGTTECTAASINNRGFVVGYCL